MEKPTAIQLAQDISVSPEDLVHTHKLSELELSECVLHYIMRGRFDDAVTLTLLGATPGPAYCAAKYIGEHYCAQLRNAELNHQARNFLADPDYWLDMRKTMELHLKAKGRTPEYIEEILSAAGYGLVVLKYLEETKLDPKTLDANQLTRYNAFIHS